MTEKNAIQPGELKDQLAEITETMQRERIEFSPEMKKYFDETLAKITDKMVKGQMPVKSELEVFIKTIKEYIEKEKFLRELEQQYQKRLETGAYFELYDKDNPVVEGIDGRQYPAPTWDEIKQVITPKHVEKVKKYIKNPMILVVPIAMPLEKFAEKVGAKKGKMKKPGKVEKSYELNSDINGDIVYFPEKYDKTNHGGITKPDLLKQKGGFNKFPGWQVLIVDGDDEVQNETLDKSADDLLEGNKSNGITGITPEEFLIMHASGVQEKGKPFNAVTSTWCTSSYFKDFGDVPYSCWDSFDLKIDFEKGIKGATNTHLGARRAVRIW